MEDQSLILYFEDEPAVAQLVMEYLGNKGYRFCHFSEYPARGLEAIRFHCQSPISIVLLDINMPGKTGYEVCEILKDDFLPDNVPVLFTSGLMDNEDIMKAFAAGADDYLIKPVRLNELAIKVSKLIEQKQQQFDAVEQSTAAMKIAFDAMKNSSELGDILRFHEAVHQAEDFDVLSDLTFSAMKNFELETTIVFLTDDEPAYYRDDMQKSQLEFESIIAARSKGRLFSWKKYSFFSYDLFTVLVRNMPIDDVERYGILKDQVCLLLNGVDARCRGILIAQSELEKQQRIASVNKILANLVLEIEQGNVNLSEQFERIITDMETNITAEVAQFSLMEYEESKLMAVVKDSMSAATALFETSLETEKQRKQVIDVLLAKLG
jgi:DNA-binding response OmpR family regulator